MRGACGACFAIDSTEIKHNAQLAAPKIAFVKWITIKIPHIFEIVTTPKNHIQHIRLPNRRWLTGNVLQVSASIILRLTADRDIK